MAEPRDPKTDLTVQATVLARQVVALTTSVQQLDVGAQRSARAVVLALAGLVLDLVLSAALIFVLIGQSSIDGDLQTEIDRQVRVRTDALCPLYELITESENPRSAAAYPGGPGAYNAAFVELRAAFTVLDCGGPP